MQYKIYKYEFEPTAGEKEIEILGYGQFLKCDVQNGKIVMWFLGDVDYSKMKVKFLFAETGQDITKYLPLMKPYYGSVQLYIASNDPKYSELYVLHIFRL